MSGINYKIYQNLPIFLQNAVCSAYGFKERRIRYGGNFKTVFNQLVKSDFASVEEIDKFQLSKLKSVLELAYDQVPYYQQIFSDLKISKKDFTEKSILSELPILTKELVFEHKDLLINKSFPKKEMIEGKTSGSTGKSLSFYQTKDSLNFRWAIWARHKYRFGVDVREFPRFATFTGLNAVPINQRKPPYWRENYFLNQTVFTMQHINKNTIFSIAEKLNADNYEYITGYPSIIYQLCILLKDNNLKLNKCPKAIFTGAETLFDHHRLLMEEVFNCTVTDQYGFSEGCGNASKCEFGYFHEDYEYGLLENFNNSKNLTGDIIATGFVNNAMPLIRYRVGDVGTWIDGDCKCGRKSRRLSYIEGRNEDFVITPEGNKILRFDYLFKDTRCIEEAQIIQNNINEIQINIIKRKNCNQEIEEILRKEVKSKISTKLLVKFNYPDRLVVGNSNKFKAVISNINRKI